MSRDRVGGRPTALRRLLATGATVLAVSAGVVTPSTAGADPGAGAPGGAAAPSAERGMRLVDLDAGVARRHGFEVVTLPDGARASVPAALAPAARAGTYVPTSGVLRKATGGAPSTRGYGELPGDCGTSWVSLDARGGGRAGLGTGMRLRPDAGDPWDVHWSVNITDDGGSSSQGYSEYDGFIGLLSWSAYTRTLGLTNGWAVATVSWWQSYTVTEHGWVCWSAGPSASEKIF